MDQWVVDVLLDDSFALFVVVLSVACGIAIGYLVGHEVAKRKFLSEEEEYRP